MLEIRDHLRVGVSLKRARILYLVLSLRLFFFFLFLTWRACRTQLKNNIVEEKLDPEFDQQNQLYEVHP